MIVKTKEQLPEELANIPASKFNMKQADDVILDEEFKTEAVGFWKDAFLRLRKSKVSVISFTVIMIIVLGAIFVPNLTGYTYTEQNVDQQYLPPKIPGLEKLGIADGTRTLRDRKVESLMDKEKYPEGSIIEIKNEHMVRGVKLADVKVDSYLMSGVPEDEYHWLGTDYMGRDLCTRLFRGARISLFIALVSVLTNCIMTHIAELMDGMPYVVITILFMLLFGSGIFSLILALCVTGWIGTSRLIRAQFYRFKEREYVLAARTLGVRDAVLIFRHILPNCIGPLITRAMIAIPGAIFSESFLAYIGLGIAPPEPSIGILLADGQSLLLQYPSQVLFPALLISVLMIAFNMFSNGLRDALDPTKRGEE